MLQQLLSPSRQPSLTLLIEVNEKMNNGFFLNSRPILVLLIVIISGVDLS